MAKHEYYAVQGKTLDNVAETMKTVLGVDKDTPIRFDEITNNEKVEQVTENVDVQAEVIEQIKAALNGKSSIGVKEIVDIIDQSGVLESTEGTATEKVEALIDKAEDENLWYLASKNISLINQNSPFIGNKYSGKTLPRIDCSNQANMIYAFASNKNLEYVDWYINSSMCSNLSNVFSFCSNLKRIKGIDTSSATDLSDAFYQCSNLESITEPFDVSKSTSFNKTFQDCKALKDIRFVPETIKVSIVILSPVLSGKYEVDENGKVISVESIQSIIDGLATVATAQTLTLHADVKAKLTEEQIATITNKNWNLA